MAEQLRLVREAAMDIRSIVEDDQFNLLDEEYESFEDNVRNLFFRYSSKDKYFSQRDFKDTQGIIGHLRGKQVSYGKYGSVYLSRREKHSLEGFNLKGIKPLSKKVTYLVNKSKFPIPYNKKNRDTLESIFSSIDMSLPLRVIVREMIRGISREWSQEYSSIYLGVLQYVYCVFLSHSNKDTPLAVVGDTYKLMLNPEDQDMIKDYPLYCYREGCKLLEEGHEWMNSPQFSMIADEPDIGFTFPWEYEVHDYLYALEPSLFKGGEDKMKFIEYIAESYMPKNCSCRTIDLTKLSRYASDTAFFLPEVNAERTVRKIDHLVMADLIKEVKNPTIERFEFLRKVIYVSQNNLRDTFIPSMKTFCALFVLESLCDPIIEKIPEIRIGKLQNRLRFDAPWYIMIDVKKFGLTFPKEVILATIGVLERIHCCDLSVYKKAYNDYIINIGSESFKGQRGFGLGNMNKLATIAHYIIAKQTGLDFYVYSDDIVYKAKSEPSEEILFSFERLYNEFGLPLNRKKCYISQNWEFLGESSHEYSEQNETNKCTLAFKDAFFSPTRIEGEIRERNALRMYSMCRDLWLKNHEIHPILREDLLEYPTQMGGFVDTNRPVNYCYSAGIMPSLYTAIKTPPKKFSLMELDEHYVTHSEFDYYADSTIRNFHIQERRKRSKWQDLTFWKKEERRYVKARIGFKDAAHLLKFSIEHLDLADHMFIPRKAYSQIKTYMRVPSVMRGGGLPNPYPVVAVRESDIKLLNQLSYFTDYPIYTKYMLELKLKTGIKELVFDIQHRTERWRNELSLVLAIATEIVEPFTHSLELDEKEEIGLFSYEGQEALSEIREFFRLNQEETDMNRKKPDEDFLGFTGLDEEQNESCDSDMLTEWSTSPGEEEVELEIEVADQDADLDLDMADCDFDEI